MAAPNLAPVNANELQPSMVGDALLLAVDTAGAHAGLVLAGEGFVEARLLPRTPGGQARTEDLAACTAALFANRGLSPRSIALLGAVAGPGSYTGLRSGLAFVRGLALAGGTPAVAIGSLELLALRGAKPGETVRTWWPAGAGRSMTAVHRREGDDVVEVEAPRVVEDGEPVVLDGAGTLVLPSVPPAPVAVAAAAHGVEVRVAEGDSLATLATLVRRRAASGLGAPASALLPVYVGQSTARPNRHRVAVPEVPE